MSVPFCYHLTLEQHSYRIVLRPGCSRLAVVCELHADTVGDYEPRWLGSSCRGGYWARFQHDIDSTLLLNMDAIARLIDEHRLAHPNTVLDTDLQPVLKVGGRLRAQPYPQQKAA
ncbi:hypothetical protein DUD43_11595 [Alcaligenes faecalis]|uniref:hypothetical protein n=1 Tax=Alcaligenes faecalis TaxID=511 RepID=UPI00129300A1|nr:hypothetical protein [Alcaligenes faecalis]QFY78283.1 hypothetical protein DUD43_11595 [Alcaligenes faecalis]